MTKTCACSTAFFVGLTFLAGCGGASLGPDADVDAGLADGSTADHGTLDGATEPDAAVTIGGRKIQLRKDGTFSFRFALPDEALLANGFE